MSAYAENRSLQANLWPAQPSRASTPHRGLAVSWHSETVLDIATKAVLDRACMFRNLLLFTDHAGFVQVILVAKRGIVCRSSR